MARTFLRLTTGYFNEVVETVKDEFGFETEITRKEKHHLKHSDILVYSYILQHSTDKNSENFFHNVTHRSIAQDLGLAPDTVSRTIWRLEKEGMVKTNVFKGKTRYIECAFVPDSEEMEDLVSGYDGFKPICCGSSVDLIYKKGFDIIDTRDLKRKDLTPLQKTVLAEAHGIQNLCKRKKKFRPTISGMATIYRHCREALRVVLWRLFKAGCLIVFVHKQRSFWNWWTDITLSPTRFGSELDA